MRPPYNFSNRFGTTCLAGFLSLTLIFATIQFGNAQEPKTVGQKNNDKNQVLKPDGAWKAKEAILNGMVLGAPFLMNLSLQLKGEEYEVKVGAKSDKGKCEISKDTKPCRMKITGAEGPNQGKTIWAIFEQENPDHLKVCYNLKKKEFPKAFESTEENGEFLVIYERVK